MKKLLLLFGFLCLGMMNVNAQGWQQPEHVLSGYVKDTSGKPISEAHVKFWSLPKDDSSRDLLLDTYTNDDGYYSIGYDPEAFQDLGSLGINVMCSKVTCEKDGYFTEEESLMVDFSSIFTGPISQDFVLEREMQDENGIQGYVRDIHGNPIPNATITLWRSTVSGDEIYDFLTENTDQMGYYKMEFGFSMLNFEYIEVTANGYEPLRIDIDDIYVDSYGGYAENNFTLNKAMRYCTVSGVVVDAITDKPIANAYVMITAEGGASGDLAGTYTDGNGNYSMTVHDYYNDGQNHEFEISCFADGYDYEETVFIFNESGVVKNFNLKKEIDGLRNIRGKVMSLDGTPLADVIVSVTLRALVGDQPKAVVTDDQGNYVIELPEGYFGDMVYWISATKDEKETTLSFIPLSEDATVVDITLDDEQTPAEPDYRNEYLVLDAETGKPIEGATVQEFYRHYQHDNGIQKGEMFVTDEMGCCTTDNRISDGFCWHPSYVMVKAADYGTEKVYVEFVLGSDSQGGLEQVIIYMRKKHVGEDAGLVDGINTVNADGKAMKHYGVSGVEIAPNAKGLHIVNGKKILVK